MHTGKPTLTYIELQVCEKFGISPLEWYTGEKWNNEEGLAIKSMILAYHQINAEEEKRIQEEMNKNIKTK